MFIFHVLNQGPIEKLLFASMNHGKLVKEQKYKSERNKIKRTIKTSVTNLCANDAQM